MVSRVTLTAIVTTSRGVGVRRPPTEWNFGAGLKAQSDRIYIRAYPTKGTTSHSRLVML